MCDDAVTTIEVGTCTLMDAVPFTLIDWLVSLKIKTSCLRACRGDRQNCREQMLMALERESTSFCAEMIAKMLWLMPGNVVSRITFLFG